MEELLGIFRSHKNILKDHLIGLEKEGLRATHEGVMAQTFHPLAFGSKLTHPYITTDYSECLLEFITNANTTEKQSIEELDKLHAFCIRNNPEEIIWPFSMPCSLPEDDKIPVANYGRSNVGRLKEVYRIGLGHRYGRSMQSIAGLHFNISIGKKLIEALRNDMKPGEDLRSFQDDLYFRLIRNYRRYNWLLVYLFGSSPCVHSNFLRNKKHNLIKVHDETFASEFATSLRMGGLGYTGAAQKNINICYNGIKTYIQTLEQARQSSYPAYEKIGVKVSGKYRQLNTNLLQIDNEFYSTIRPKHPARSGQSALGALYESGIEYVEMRVMDLDPFEKAGISPETARFLHLFALTCLAMPGDKIQGSECDEIGGNFERVVTRGREQGLTLKRLGVEVSLKDLGMEFLEKVEKVACIIDSDALDGYKLAVLKQKQKIMDLEKTPSHKVFELSKQKGFLKLGCELASSYHHEYLTLDLPEGYEEQLHEVATKSLDQQLELEENDVVDFDEFMKNYFESIKIHW